MSKPESTPASEVLDEEKLKGPQESPAGKDSEQETCQREMNSQERLQKIDDFLDQMKEDLVPVFSIWSMPSSPSASEVIHEEKLMGPQESPAATESEEEKLTEPPLETTTFAEETDEEEFTGPPLDKKKEDDACRSLQEEMAMLFNPSLEVALRRWEGVSCSISPCLKEDGDYLCTNVLHTWPELRKTRSYRGPIDAGLAVARNVRCIDYTGMIERCVVCGPGFLKLKLSMKWIAKSIFKMLKGGIVAWAPKLPVKKTIIHCLPPSIVEDKHNNHLRSTILGQTIARILEYSGVEVIQTDMEIKYESYDYKPLIVDLLRKKDLTVSERDHQAILIEGRMLPLVALITLWCDLNRVQADSIVHVTDVGQRDHFEMCIIAAKRAGWIGNDHSPCSLSHVGFGLVQADDERFQILSSTKVVSLGNLFREAKSRCKAVLVGQVKDLEYMAKVLGYGAVKYAILKTNRLTNYTINFDELFNEKEDTGVYLQYTHAQICSVLKIYKKPIERLKKLKVEEFKELKLENNEERELGLHILRFTEVLEEVCKVLMPHILCEYLYDLCKKFDNSSVCQVVDGNDSSKLLLCYATAVVMRKCFHFLEITPIYKAFRLKGPPVAEPAKGVSFSGLTEEQLLKVPPVAEPAVRVSFSDLTEEQLLKVPPVAEPAKGVSFSGLTEEQLLKVPPVAEPAVRVSFSDLTEEQLLKVPPVADLAVRVSFSDLTEEQLMTLFCEGPCFRFELRNVLLRHNTDASVENGNSYAELRLFGIIQAEIHISDPSHYGSFNIFKRNFDDPLVFNNPGSLSPHDICYCSLSVSTFVKITAKLYGTTYKGDGMESLSDYTRCYLPTWRMRMDKDKDKYLKGLKKFLLDDILIAQEESKGVYIDDDAFEVCDDYAFIDFSESFAKTPNVGAGFCKLKGKDGYLDLHYVALKYAVEATLKVHFAATSEETKVVGRVRAYYGKNFCYDCAPAKKDLYSAMLFEIEQHTDLFVEPGKINLMRSVLAVPAQYSLIIDANLCDFTSRDELLSGVWEFLVPTDGSRSHGVIYGNNCSLKLKVDWKLPPDMPPLFIS